MDFWEKETKKNSSQIECRRIKTDYTNKKRQQKFKF